MKNKKYPYYEPAQLENLSDMLEKKAAYAGEKTALRFRKGKKTIESKTYRELYSEVKAAAEYVEKTCGKGNHIGLIGENSYEWLLASLAAVTSGNVAVPIDKGLPADEIAELIKMADVNVVFVSDTYADLVEEVKDIKVFSQKELRKLATGTESDYKLYRPESCELAFIFFTSGTSGKSKGVMLSHGNVAAEIMGASSLFNPEGDSTLSVLPFNHAFGLIVAVYMAINYETTVFINKSLKSIKDDLAESKPDIVMLVPLFIETFYKQIMEAVKSEGKEKKLKQGIKISNALLKVGIDSRRRLFGSILDVFGGRLKWIISGGAPLDSFYVEQFRNFGIEILNGYGTTECSPCVAVNRNYHHKDGSVGCLVPGMEAAVSEEGEVLLKGDVVMQGYYGNPEATSEVITDGWYHTGDLGRIDEDGFIFLTGRAKNLIILSNGENISPEEIETDIQRDPGVCEVLVYGVKNKLVAEIFPEEAFLGNSEYFEKLIEKVNEGRPAYKQVASVRLRDVEFIKNTTKKIVRYKNLPEDAKM
ncbi:MAG: AMP-binding protein [Lachnospiraceae bacterium]|nr:AMP-binding protein [Lachnospiraceae bacterium]